MTQSTIYDDFARIVDEGDEEKAKTFLIEHLSEFPEEVQEEIKFAFFEKALSQEAETSDAVAEFKSKGLQFMKDVSKLKEEIKDTKKAEQVRKDLGI